MDVRPEPPRDRPTPPASDGAGCDVSAHAAAKAWRTTVFWQGQPSGSHDAAAPGASDFGPYELLEEVGRGGMGVVYRARQKGLDRVVAIKMILGSHLASAEQVDRFYAEARAAARLHDLNIVAIHDIGQVAGHHYFAMDFIDGPPLSTLTASGPLDCENAARIVRDIARAVGRMHAQGLIHRDLKPSNILLDRDGRPFVTDFGLVKLLEGGARLTTSGAIVGSPCYMAPEQAAGRADRVGTRSDVYGLGAILYELLTGRPPYNAASRIDTILLVLEGEPEAPSALRPDLPRSLERVCLKCLEKSPDDRYPTAEAVADDLERFLHGEPTEARRGGIVHRLGRWSRREPALAVHLGALGVVVALTQFNYGFSPEPDPPLHWAVTGILAAWALASLLFARLPATPRWPDAVPMAWIATDVVLATVILGLLEAASSGLTVAYPLLIAASGLWFRERLVWFATLLAIVDYLALVGDAGRRHLLTDRHHNVVVAAMAVLGFVVAHQVRRVRILSRHFEARNAP